MGMSSDGSLRGILPLEACFLHEAGIITNFQDKEGTTMAKLLKILKDEKGATAIEYGLLAALIAVVIIGAVTALGVGVKGTFDTIATSL